MRKLAQLLALGLLTLSFNSAFAQSDQEKPEEKKPELTQIFNGAQIFNDDEQGAPKSESTD